MMSQEIEEKKYRQAFKADYCIEYPFIKPSYKGINYKFYVDDAVNISVGHGIKNYIEQHQKKNINNVEANVEKEKNKMRDCLLSKNEVTRVEGSQHL